MNELSTLFHEVFRVSNEDAPDLVTDHLTRFGYTVQRSDSYVYAEGSIPVLVVAHTDTIHRRTPKDIYHDPARHVVWSPTGLGADDRAGVYAILTLLSKNLYPHVLFPDGEESGGEGAKEAARDLQPDVRCLLELDRRSSNDAVTYQCHSKSWDRYLERRGWALDCGTYTDIVDLMPAFGVAGVNLSIGYYSQHTLGEYLRTDQLATTIARVAKMLRRPPQHRFHYKAYAPLDSSLALDLDAENYWRRNLQDDEDYEDYGRLHINPDSDYWR